MPTLGNTPLNSLSIDGSTDIDPFNSPDTALTVMDTGISGEEQQLQERGGDTSSQKQGDEELGEQEEAYPFWPSLLSKTEAKALEAWVDTGVKMGADSTDLAFGGITEYVWAAGMRHRTTVQMQLMVPMTEQRHLELRPGRMISFKRQQNAEAAIGQLRGRLKKNACESCKGCSGPFTQCVVVRNALKGACANCHYGGEGRRCNFHESFDSKSDGSLS
jgi:hypothetical protein